jgi:hypothetical protein
MIHQSTGPAPHYADILVAQHNRGREITDYILSVTGSGRTIAGQAARLPNVLYQFVLMCQSRRARKHDRIPSMKDALSQSQNNEMSQQVVRIEGETVGERGFADANRRIAEIAAALGSPLTDLAQFTAAPARG